MEKKRLAVFFPGIGYSNDKPLLYYGRDVAYEAGYIEYYNVSYGDVNKDGVRGNRDKMSELAVDLLRRTESQLSAIDWRAYEDILFVSKSVGTFVATAYAKKHQLTNIKHVLYTPLEFTYDNQPQNAIAFLGTNDGWSDVEEIVKRSRQASIPLTLYEGCNHSLETEDVFRNLEILQDVMVNTKKFIGE